MSPRESLAQFHQHYLREHLPELPQPFNVFPIATGASPQSLPYSRRDFYQISLYTGGITQLAFLTQLFQQMLTEVNSTYRYKSHLLRTHVQLLLHEALRMPPDLPHLADPTAASRLATQFLQLLAAQFPVPAPTRPLALHTAEACAAHLGVHVNYLSRMLREATGRSTSAHLAARITQEGKRLLRHSEWSIADVAEALGFADPTYFNHFFRKHAGTSPTAFRRAEAPQPARLANSSGFE